MRKLNLRDIQAPTERSETQTNPLEHQYSPSKAYSHRMRYHGVPLKKKSEKI